MYQESNATVNYVIIIYEFHFILECTLLNDLRFKFLPKRYHKYPNAIKFSNLLNSKLCNYIEEGLKLF